MASNTNTDVRFEAWTGTVELFDSFFKA